MSSKQARWLQVGDNVVGHGFVTSVMSFQQPKANTGRAKKIGAKFAPFGSVKHAALCANEERFSYLPEDSTVEVTFIGRQRKVYRFDELVDIQNVGLRTAA